MWCERVVRNAADGGGLASRAVDYVDVAWDQCRSTLKATSRAGEPVRVLLPRGQALRHGDVLYEDDARAVVVNVVPCELIIVRSENARLLATLALELGNLHWPTQVNEVELLFVEEVSALAAARRLGLGWTREARRFDPVPIMSTAVRLANNLRVIRSSGSAAEGS